RIRLHVLAIGNGPALPTLNAIADATGGSYTAEQNAGRWLAVARRMLQASRTDLLRGPVTARFDGTLKLPSRSIDQANRAFIRPDASPLASDNLAARWQVGNGQVIAAAFAPNDAERE